MTVLRHLSQAGRRRRRRHVPAAAVVVLVGAVMPLYAQEPQQQPTETPSPVAGEGEAAPTPSLESVLEDEDASAEVEDEQVNPCRLEGQPDERAWLEKTRRGLGLTVCRTALWFDGLFGSERIYQERDATFGWVQPSLGWNEIDGVEPDLRFRAKVSLPRLDRRMSALVGRTDPDDVVEDAPGADLHVPEAFRDTDDEWLLGLGYTPVRGLRRRLDLNAGVEIRSPVEVFVQGRYRRQWFASERLLIRLRQTEFWHSQDRLGASTRLDVERLLSTNLLLRWRMGGTVAQRIEGVEWFGELVLFQRLADHQALAYRIAATGESDAELENDRYDLSVAYRRRFVRDWLFLELRPGATWRRPEEGAEGELSPAMGIAIELQFGDWPDVALRP
jgi:hypothetical protein